MRLTRILAVARVELLRLLRDRTSISLVLVVPAFQIILFGAAVDLNPKNIPIAVAGGSPSAQEQVVGIIRDTGYFKEPIVSDDAGTALAALTASRVKIAIEIPDDSAVFDNMEADFGSISVTIDGADTGAIAPALGALERLVWRQAALDLAQSNQQAGVFKRLENIEFQWLYNPERNTSWTILPGLIGVVVMISMLMLGALSLVREREAGTWEALMLLPITASDAHLGKMLPYTTIAVIQVVLVCGAAVALFGVPIVGSALLLGVAATALALAHLCLGFVISLKAQNQLQALQAAVAFYLPSMLLSGFMFPFEGMPVWAQKLGSILPLTHFVDLARDVMLRGAISGYGVNLAAIMAFALFFASLAVIMFNRSRY